MRVAYIIMMDDCGTNRLKLKIEQNKARIVTSVGQ